MRKLVLEEWMSLDGKNGTCNRVIFRIPLNSIYRSWQKNNI
jgi:hypothetical protein